MKIRTAIFGVYVTASAVGFAIMMVFVLRDVRLRYVESMRRTLGDTAAFLAVFVEPQEAAGEAWAQKLATLPAKAELLRVFACDPAGRVLFDSAQGHDVGRVYAWTMTGGGHAASEGYSTPNVAIVDGELRVAAPVRRGARYFGCVGVGRPLATISEGVRRARWDLVVSLSSIAAVMVAAGWWIASRLTHSLERLTAYAQAVRDGRPAEPPQSQAREIAALGRAFEEMRVALEGKAHVERYTQALAHEFKAPLSAIRGGAELLAEDMPAADRARFVAHLRAESDRLQLIVERLLELAALESRRAGSALAPVALDALVREAVALGEPQAAARRIALATDLATLTVAGDRFLLSQAVTNLLQNALDFTPSGGAVRVTVREAEGRAEIAVEDTGPGIPEYALEKVFERFYSLPRPDTGRKSSGLGLSIVREIARLHGGEIALANRPEGGARAALTLPRA